MDSTPGVLIGNGGVDRGRTYVVDVRIPDGTGGIVSVTVLVTSLKNPRSPSRTVTIVVISKVRVNGP